MITAMKVGPTVRRVLVPLTLAVFFVSSLASAQTWEDSDVGAPPDVGQPAPAQPAPAPQPAAPDPNQYPDTDPSALTEFHPALDPHGRWVSDPTYGVVWVPNESEVGKDFAPYVTSGYGKLTRDNQWIWVSDYPFGWVVFHYGRWVWIPGTGWAWIPGRQYANAWVVWRVPTDDYAYVGWAPMPPSYVWVDGAAVGLWFTVPAPYVFCHSHYIFHHHVHTYIVHDHYRVRYIAERTRVYRPATPGRRYASPTPREAGIPARSLPRGRVAADPRAVAAARRQTSGPARFTPSPAPGQRLRTSRSLGTTYSATPRTGSAFSAAPAPGTNFARVEPRRAAPVGARPADPAGVVRLAPSRPAPASFGAAPAPARPVPAPAPAAPAPARRLSSKEVVRASPSTSWSSPSPSPRSSWSSAPRPSSAPRSSWSSAPRSSWSSAPRSSWSSAPRSSPSRSFSAPSRAAPSRRR